MFRSIYLVCTLLSLLPGEAFAAQELFKPILPLDTSWKMPGHGGDLSDNKDIIQSNSVTSKAQATFRDSMNKLARPMKSADQAKEINVLRQAATKLGPKARVIAELTAARITGGLSAGGGKAGKPSGNWRQHLLAACNAASKTDDVTHEKTAIQSIAMWRRIEGHEASWALPPIDLKAQRQFEFAKALTERQAIYDWSKGNEAAAFKKYRALAVQFNASTNGAAIDMRLIELERAHYRKEKQLRRWQKALIETTDKYQDKQFLGAGNESKAERIFSTVSRIHKELIDTLIREASSSKASDAQRKDSLAAIERYLGTSISDPEKLRVRVASGEIQYLAGNHKAAAGIFAGIATEISGAQAQDLWKRAIRSQTLLADWPKDAPWTGIPKGSSESRIVLASMYKHLDHGTAADWPLLAHIGLLNLSSGQEEEAFTLWNERLQKFPAGGNAARAAGWIIEAYIKRKKWTELEAMGRILTKANLTALHQKTIYRPRDVLGLALLEIGLQSLETSDFKTAITKLDEYVKGWRGDKRHDQGFYSLALAYQGDKQFRNAVTTLVSFTKMHTNSKYRHDALVQGGAWTLALAWEDHVIYFLESHAMEFPKDRQSIASLQTLADLYMGREIYDSAIRVMTILIARSELDAGMRHDVARRLLDTSERQGSPATAIRTADKLLSLFKNEPLITATAFSVKARVFAEQKNIQGLNSADKQIRSLDQSIPGVAEMVSEVRFLLADTSAMDKFKESVFSLGSRDPKGQLEKGYAEFTELDQLYKSACLPIRTGWCGPAFHRAARKGEDFLKAYDDLSIAKTLDPEDVASFRNRKKSVIDTVERLIVESDEKSLEQAKSGSTNPEWNTAIMWKIGNDWSHPKFTSETTGHFIQWHAR